MTWRLPPVDVPLDTTVDEALMVGVGSSDAMDFHALEALQCMVEHRRGGETGIKAVQLLEGAEVWQAGADGRWSHRLLEAALARSDSRSGVGAADGRPQDLVGSGELRQLGQTACRLLDRICRRFARHLVDAQRRGAGLHFRGPCNGVVAATLDPVSPGAPCQTSRTPPA